MKMVRASSAVFASVLLFGCAQTVSVQRTAAVPAATAQAKLRIDDNQNAQVALEVAHLAPAKNLTPARAVYVVWAQTREGRSFSLGKLRLDKEGEGQFTGTIPVYQFRLLVTAEDSAAAERPSEQVVLQTDYVSAN